MSEGGQLARDHGGFLEDPTGLDRARQEGPSGGVREELDELHAARQAHAAHA